ncbi:MAG TPA: PKD domain-containing protein [Candidatus Saccharimonadales bacterium]|nr:PKD domain-containing protein [Candidatus Saccharimonadales bacterium]
MNVFTNAIARVRRMSSKKLIVAGVFTLALAATVGLGLATKQHSSAQDCSPNSIVKCGYSNPADFQAKYNANVTGDLKTIYQYYGLAPSDMTKFVKYAELGVAKQDGTIVVDGHVVATNVTSLGRDHFSYASPLNIGGHTYYSSADTRVLLSDIPVYVLFDAKGVMQFAVMTECGNPATGYKVVPNYNCSELQMTPVSGKLNTYNFSSKVSYGNGATLNHVTYDFGDGTSQTVTNPSQVISHTYTTEGTFTAKVTAYFNLPGAQLSAPVTNGSCAKSVTIHLPVYLCNYLSVAVVDKDKFQYRFTLNTTAQYGATLQSADFVFDQNDKTQVANGVTPNAQGVITVDHTYAKAGTYQITTAVHFNVNGKTQTVQSNKCVATVSPTMPPQPCQPGGTPAPGSPECSPQPCQPGGTPAPGSPECSTPSTPLPNTGAGNVIGLFAGTTIVAAVAHRLFRSRRLARETA